MTSGSPLASMPFYALLRDVCKRAELTQADVKRRGWDRRNPLSVSASGERRIDVVELRTFAMPLAFRCGLRQTIKRDHEIGQDRESAFISSTTLI